MRKRHLGLWATLVLLAVGGGCTPAILVGIDPGGDAGAGSGAGGAGGAGGGSGTSRLTGPQPGMAAVTSPGGVTYSIDNTEVTQAAYAAFLATSPTPDPTSTTCGWKTTFAPASEPTDANEAEGDPGECHPSNTHYDPVAHADDPVVCVDWCDAEAYCRWAGKRLCGRIGGGAATEDDYNDATQDQWFNACSNGGTTDYSYGATFVDGACNGYPAVAAVGTTSGCHGTAPPYDGIFDMSGNVAEWEDNCGVNPFDQDGGVPAARCLVRGGQFFPGTPPPSDPNGGYVSNTTTCGDPHFGDTGDSRNFERPETGIRCCAD